MEDLSSDIDYRLVSLENQQGLLDVLRKDKVGREFNLIHGHRRNYKRRKESIS